MQRRPTRPRTTRSVRLAALGIGLVLGAACRSVEQREETRQAELLAAAVRTLRDAPHDAKGPPLAALRAVPCTTPQACEVRELCAQAYALHERAMTSGVQVRAHLARGAAVDSAAASALLTESANELARSKQMAEECLRLETQLLLDTRP